MGTFSLPRLLTGLRPDFRRRPFFKFIEQRSGPFPGSASLSRDRVYIIPTRAGMIFSLLLLVLLIGSIHYEKSLGYILTFLLTGIGNTCLLATWRNLAGLQLRAEKTHPVFAGEKAGFSLQLNNVKPYHRFAIALSYRGIERDLVNCAANSRQLIGFSLAASRRGHLRPGHFRLYTEFPGGLFIAWTWLDLSLDCMVYPAPDPGTLLPMGARNDSGHLEDGGRGPEHFSHLAKYQAGDNINRISWKAAARTDELFSKCFTGAAAQTLWINWHDIPAKDNEQRLSIMTAMIINADKNHQPYALTLPGRQIKPGLGRAHYHRCLTELALF